jgi:peptidoglycan hydrolase-like protein with peptidoglycan-binding domain
VTATASWKFWRSVKNSNKPEELNSHLTRYPNGEFRSLPLTRLAALKNGGSQDKNATQTRPRLPKRPARSVRTRSGSTAANARDVQCRLIGLGFDTRVTGIFGRQTRSAIKRWQAAGGYPVSGFLNELPAQGTAFGKRRDHPDRF